MLKEKVVFITGASSGIGEACAHYFAKAGARLLLCARRIDVLKQLASQLQNAYGVKVQAIELDVCQRTSVKNI